MADKERLKAFLSAYILGGHTVVTGKKRYTLNADSPCTIGASSWQTNQPKRQENYFWMVLMFFLLLFFLLFFFSWQHIPSLLSKPVGSRHKPIVYFCFIWQSQNNCYYVAAYSPSLFHYRISHNMQKAFTWIIILLLNQILTSSTNTEVKKSG